MFKEEKSVFSRLNWLINDEMIQWDKVDGVE
jgi:hypothetical protein